MVEGERTLNGEERKRDPVRYEREERRLKKMKRREEMKDMLVRVMYCSHLRQTLRASSAILR